MNYVITLLSVYPDIEKRTKAIDELIYKQCLYSHADKRSVEDIVNDVFLLQFEKETLTKLKDKISKVLSRLSDEENMLLQAKYSNNRLIGTFNYSRRTYFRRQIALLNKLCEYFNYIGLTEEKFKEYNEIPFISHRHNRLKNTVRVRREENSKTKVFGDSTLVYKTDGLNFVSSRARA